MKDSDCTGQYTKRIYERGGVNYFCCSNCWTKDHVFNRENPVKVFSTFTVGVNRKIRYVSDVPQFKQYSSCEWEPFIHETFKFCHLCSPYMTERIFEVVAECAPFSRAGLLNKPDQPDLIHFLGHHLTLAEYIPCGSGRYFNIQVNKKIYREIITEKLPKNLIQFHLHGYYEW